MTKKFTIISVLYNLMTIIFLISVSEAANRPKISNKNLNRSNQKVSHNLGIGMRFHKEHSNFESLPFSNGDKSYTISYEYHEGIGYWLLGVGFTPDLKEDESVEKIITPQLSLIIKDRIYRAGVGILKSYISDKDKILEDTDIYYQFSLGLSIPMFSKFSIDVSSLYAFEKWGDIKFKFEDVDYSVIINFTF